MVYYPLSSSVLHTDLIHQADVSCVPRIIIPLTDNGQPMRVFFNYVSQIFWQIGQISCEAFQRFLGVLSPQICSLVRDFALHTYPIFLQKKGFFLFCKKLRFSQILTFYKIFYWDLGQGFGLQVIICPQSVTTRVANVVADHNDLLTQ